MHLRKAIYNSTNKVFDAAGRVRPLLYLAIFLLCIPLFAFLYWNMPGAFYAPYAKLEPSAKDDVSAIARVVESAMQTHLATLEERRQKSKDQYILPIDDWSLEPQSAHVVQGGVEENEIHLTFAVRLMNAVGQSAVVNVPIIIRSWRVVDRDDVYIHIDYDYKKVGEGNQIFKAYLQKYHVFQGMPLAFLDLPQRRLIESYIEGYGGDPLGISKSYFRMLYFSVIVITTVGFGDIIPMTSASRSFVAIEAIAGIVLAGLFINAAASRSRSNSTKNLSPNEADGEA